MAELGETAHVVAPDLLGHGSSAKPRGDYSLGAHANGLRDLLAALGHDRVTVVGHSLGGGIAMQFAYQFPERVERLALVGAGGLGREVTPLLRAATLPGAELVLPVLTALVAATRRHLARRPAGAGRVAAAGGRAGGGGRLQRDGRPGPGGVRPHGRSVVDPFGQRVDARDRLHVTAHLPLLVVWGRRDTVVPVAHGGARRGGPGRGSRSSSSPATSPT